MDVILAVSSRLGDEWLPVLYREKIRTQRTRAITIEVPSKENLATIQHTLLGIELKVGKRRFACPDLAAARYMRVFARIGCPSFAIPYDISKVSAAADLLETSWQQAGLILAEVIGEASTKALRAHRANLVRSIRRELADIGPGDAMPAFDRPTKQRSR